MRRTAVIGGVLAVAGSATAAGYVGLVTGRLTVDLGLGRRDRRLGPLQVDIAASPGIVFEAAAAPYAERRPRAMREKVDILARTDHMVLAAHRTPIRRGLTAVTVETVTLDPPHRMGFRLVRGPVPYVCETFELTGTDTGTRLRYDGELATDLWALGEWWGDLVAKAWVGTVRASLRDIRIESERRAALQQSPGP